jgi:TolA-binding protein
MIDFRHPEPSWPQQQALVLHWRARGEGVNRRLWASALPIALMLAGAFHASNAGAAAPAVMPPPIVQTPSEPVDPDQAYLDGLRERKLYRLLETYCRRQLARPDASPADAARYTIELANLLAARAQTETRSNVRADLWQQASTLLRDFLDRNSEHPQAAVLRFQIGAYEFAQGELARQQAKLAPPNSEMTDAARSHLKTAIQAFRQIDSDSTEAIKKRGTNETATPGQPTLAQLRAVTNNSRFRLAQSLLALAQTFPRNSADQTDSAMQAKTLFEAFSQRNNTNELTLESYLGRAECLRLLGDSAEAMKVLANLSASGTPDKYYDRQLVLRAQIQMDQKNAAAARNFIDDARKLQKSPNPELDLLYVQALLELARDQSKGQANLVARQLVAAAIEEMNRIEKQHGAYWVSRCEMLLAELAAENVLVEDPSVLIRMADGQFRRGDRSGTVRTLDRAVKLAQDQGDANQTVQLAFRAASILVQEKQFSAAAERFNKIATTFANHSMAPQAQFMVAYCLGQIYGASPSPERLAAYERALEEHLRAFESEETAIEVRWLLGSLRMNQRRWLDAIELFRAITPKHKQYAAARDQMRRAYESCLQDLWQRGQPADAVFAAAAQFLKQSLADRRGKQWTADDIPFALSLARIDADVSAGRFQEAEEILTQILFGKAANDSQRAEARRLIVTSLLGQEKFDAARQMIETEFVGLPQELFAIAQSLEDASAHSSESRRRHIGRLQLVATERLVKDAEQLTPEQSVQAEIYLALAYVNAGQAARADELFAKLHDRVANDPRVLEAQAECFMQLGRYVQARDLWRKSLGLLQESSPGWYRAKYQLALSCFHSGDATQALKIILVTEQLHPDLGGAELKARFEDLKAKCRAGK